MQLQVVTEVYRSRIRNSLHSETEKQGGHSKTFRIGGPSLWFKEKKLKAEEKDTNLNKIVGR